MEHPRQLRKINWYRWMTILVFLVIFGCGTHIPKDDTSSNEPAHDCAGEVALIGQERSQWCWAAAMEMVTGYYGDSLSQYQFAKEYCRISGTTCNRAIDSCSNDNYYSSNDDLNKAILFQNGKDLYSERVLNTLGYNAKESRRDEGDTLDLRSLEEELEQGPIIIYVHKVSARNQWVNPNYIPYAHALVVKSSAETAYLSSIFNGEKFFISYDPQEGTTNCSGCRLLLPSSVFEEEGWSFNAFNTWIHEIKPKEREICDSPTVSISLEDRVFIQSIDSTIGSSYNFSEFLQQVANAKGYSYNSQSNTGRAILTYSYSPNSSINVIVAQHNNMLFYFEKSGESTITIKGVTESKCSDLDLGVLGKVSLSLFEKEGILIDSPEYAEAQASLRFFVSAITNAKFHAVTVNGSEFYSPLRSYSKNNEPVLVKGEWYSLEQINSILTN